MSTQISRDEALSIAVTSLLRGPVYEEEDQGVWATVHGQAGRIHDALRVLGLRMIVDDADGYAYARTFDELPEGMPRLMRRHRMTFRTTVLLVLLRQRMTTAEAEEATPRLILTQAEIVEMMRLYHPKDTTDERIATDIVRLVDLGFLKRLRASGDTFEARRIIKALVTADWLSNYAAQLLEQKREIGAASAAPRDADDPGEAEEVEQVLVRAGTPHAAGRSLASAPRVGGVGALQPGGDE